MNVIITGATGFLGKYLLKRFVEDKSNVVVITRNAKKIDEEIRQKITIIESNLAGLKNITNTLVALRGIFFIILLGKEHLEILEEIKNVNYTM